MEFNAGLFCPFCGKVCQINLHPTLHCQAIDAHMDKSRFIFMNGFSKLALYQGSLVIVQRLVRELWDDAGHDDPLGQRRVLPVGDHHLRLPTLRHRAQVEVQERLALQCNPVSPAPRPTAGLTLFPHLLISTISAVSGYSPSCRRENINFPLMSIS